MEDLEMKKKIAQEIMDLMDQKDGDRLKSHPKLMAASIEVGKKPELDMLKGDDDEKFEDPKEESLESPAVEKAEDSSEISPEMIQKLIEMMNGK